MTFTVHRIGSASGLFLGLSLMMAAEVCSADIRMEQDGSPPQLIELYTSQGCSSCPSADRWLNAFKGKPKLWEDFVPVAFHVDYWNYLGWPDTFSKKQYSERQRAYRRSGRVGSVYTPGFIVDGREWRGYFKDRKLPVKSRKKFGKLVVSGAGAEIDILWLPSGQVEDGYIGNVALLGFDLSTKIERGENRRKILPYEFTVLHFEETLLTNTDEGWKIALDLPSSWQSEAPRYGLAVWVTSTSAAKPLQVVGGWVSIEDITASSSSLQNPGTGEKSELTLLADQTNQ